MKARLLSLLTLLVGLLCSGHALAEDKVWTIPAATLSDGWIDQYTFTAPENAVVEVTYVMDCPHGGVCINLYIDGSWVKDDYLNWDLTHMENCYFHPISAGEHTLEVYPGQWDGPHTDACITTVRLNVRTMTAEDEARVEEMKEEVNAITTYRLLTDNPYGDTEEVDCITARVLDWDDVRMVDAYTLDEGVVTASFYAYGTVQVHDFHYRRPFKGTTWEALYLPFSIPVDKLPQHIEVAQVHNFVSINCLNITPYVGDTLYALHPYLIRSLTGEALEMDMQDVVLSTHLEGGIVEAPALPGATAPSIQMPQGQTGRIVRRGPEDFEEWEIPFYGVQNNDYYNYNDGNYYIMGCLDWPPVFRWYVSDWDDTYEFSQLTLLSMEEEGGEDIELIAAYSRLQQAIVDLEREISAFADWCSPDAIQVAQEALEHLHYMYEEHTATAAEVQEVLEELEAVIDDLHVEYFPPLTITEWEAHKITTAPSYEEAKFMLDGGTGGRSFVFRQEQKLATGTSFQMFIDGVACQYQRYTTPFYVTIPLEPGEHQLRFVCNVSSQSQARGNYLRLTEMAVVTSGDQLQQMTDHLQQEIMAHDATLGDEERQAAQEMLEQLGQCTTLEEANALRSAYDKVLENLKHLYLTVDLDAAGSNLAGYIQHYGYAINDVYGLRLQGTLTTATQQSIHDGFSQLRRLRMDETTMPEGQRIIIREFLYRRHNITYVTLPANVEEIYPKAFAEVSVSPTLPSTLKKIYSEAFYDSWNSTTLVLPEGLETIGSGAFYNANVKEIDVPLGCVIELKAFELSDLERVHLPEGYDLGNSSQQFYFCHKLEEINIPQSVRTIPYRCFYNTRLRHVDLSHVTSIAEDAFRLASLGEVIMPEHLDALGSHAFGHMDPEPMENLYDINHYVGSMEQASLSIPDGITSLKDYTFHGCAGLKEITSFDPNFNSVGYAVFQGCGFDHYPLPSAVVDLGDRTFRDNRNMVDITIDDNVQRIGMEAFNYCRNLHKVTLPARLVEVDERAFSNTSLSTVACHAFIPPTVTDTTAFSSYGVNAYNQMGFTYQAPGITLQVPRLVEDLYRQAPVWRDFDIQPYDYVPRDIYVTQPLALDNEMISPSLRANLHVVADYKGRFGAYTNYGASTLTLGTMELATGLDGGVFLNEAPAVADSLSLTLYPYGRQWYFFMPPFDVAMSDIDAHGLQFAVCRYSGDARANGFIGWNYLRSIDTLHAGQGYIINVEGTPYSGGTNQEFSDYAHPVTLSTRDTEGISRTLSHEEQSVTVYPYSKSFTPVYDRGWNLTGNPFPTYYDITKLPTDLPIVVFDNRNNVYRAYFPNEGDRLKLKPFEAFFTQVSGEEQTITFPTPGRSTEATYTEEELERLNSAVRRAPGHDQRQTFDLQLRHTNEDTFDQLRLVVNPSATLNYDMGQDVSKFFADGSATAQLFALTGSTPCMVCERPLADGIFPLGALFARSGQYIICLPQEDTHAQALWLEDTHTGRRTLLTGTEGYTFHADEGFCLGRFYIHVLPQEETGVSAPDIATGTQAPAFDLSGRRLQEASQARIFIQNHKKYIHGTR